MTLRIGIGELRFEYPCGEVARRHAMSLNIRTIEARDVDAVIKAACILIVEDEFTTRKAISALLLSMGVTDVHDAGDGASGLAAVSTLDPDVVMLDWQLAGMSGSDFVRQVRSRDRCSRPNVPIIMLTGHREPSHVIEAMRLGVHEFLVKPVSARALCGRLASVLLTPSRGSTVRAGI